MDSGIKLAGLALGELPYSPGSPGFPFGGLEAPFLPREGAWSASDMGTVTESW
jgi:hypothetical protein